MKPVRACQHEIELVHAEIFEQRISRREQSQNGARDEGGIPFFITQAQKARLREVGYTDDQITLMRPAEAQAILRGAIHLNLDDTKIIELASQARNADKFLALFRDGDLSRHNNDDSKADCALLCMLLFWTQGDAGQAERLFWQSALAQRGKWKTRPDYRALTIAAAAERVTEYYQPMSRDNVSGQNGAGQMNNNSTFSVINDDCEPEVPVRFSDIALSNQFADEQGADLRYVRMFDRWYEYHENAGRWIEDRKLRIYTRVKRFLVSIATTVKAEMEAAAAKEKDNPDKAQKIRDAARALATALTSGQKVQAVVTLTRSHGAVAAVPEQFDANIFLLNARGCAVDLRTGKDRPARREDYFTMTTPVPAHNEPTPAYDQFMREIMGCYVPPERCTCGACALSGDKPADERKELHQAEVKALVRYLERQVYGPALTGDATEHKLFLQIGPGGNGKTVCNDFMSRQIFGHHPEGYASEIPIEALLESKSERHPTDLMTLWHSRLALARESDEDTRWNEGRVKRLTGGDRITARYMRHDFIEFDPTHTLIVFGQAKPVLSGADQAAWKRRLQIIPFPQLWDDQADEAKGIRQRDPRLGEKLQKEAPGVLYKLIQACKEWYDQRNFKAPLTVLAASSNYLNEQSSILAFLDERYDRSNPYDTVTVNDIWPEWVRWSEARNERPGARRDFNAKLERAGIKLERTGAQRGICKGLKLRPPDDPASR